jgi:hypothetical protein
VLLANGSAEDEQISQTFLLFGDPATALKIPLPRMPTGVEAIRQESNRVRITWNAALDSSGNAVAGYNIYRANAPAGPYSMINTELVTDTVFVDSGGVVGAGLGAAAGSSYYAVSSQDSGYQPGFAGIIFGQRRWWRRWVLYRYRRHVSTRDAFGYVDAVNHRGCHNTLAYGTGHKAQG